ncbi:hypothetical protein HNP86_001877 [Methanococcus maripaludis]|uniref:Uncharacterized protein n=1 Tax=Methanococcus maripaludis TaxID=39152 RepID=A0A7J9NVL5_METMI|nr:hypothetical protein [Methanococcus maripaludis]
MSLYSDVKALKTEGKTIDEISVQLGVNIWIVRVVYYLV